MANLLFSLQFFQSATCSHKGQSSVMSWHHTTLWHLIVFIVTTKKKKKKKISLTTHFFRKKEGKGGPPPPWGWRRRKRRRDTVWIYWNLWLSTTRACDTCGEKRTFFRLVAHTQATTFSTPMETSISFPSKTRNWINFKAVPPPPSLHPIAGGLRLCKIWSKKLGKKWNQLVQDSEK